MKRLVVILLILSMSVLAACNPVSLEEAEAQFCTDLSDFRTALTAYRGLDENSTLDAVSQAEKMVTEAYADLIRSADLLRDVQTDALNEEYDVLAQTIAGLEGEATVGQATAEINSVLESIDAAADEIYSMSCR